MATPTLFTSNRLELLARELAQNIRAPLASPFAPEMIAVQSQSMARWLRLELAREHGISANYWFPFPKHFALWIFSSALPESVEQSPFEPDSLVWVIFKSLPGLLDQPEFGPLKNYLSNGDPRKLFQLSDRIARLFDQYTVFRPDMILDWDAGKGDGWQPILWRQVTGEIGTKHPAALRKAFLDFALKPDVKFARPAERISIFGISALPKFYLEMFEAFAPHAQISLYLLQPCAQWWGYISSDRQTEKTLQRLHKKSTATKELHLERGNRLLASLGQQGREFLNLLHDFDWREQDQSQEILEDTLLHSIQADIFNLHDRGANGGEKKPIAAEDDSIRIHDCHSPLREMEVLHDHLLDWFQRDPTLTPRDILVVTPDIETYAPFIRAVFESPENEAHRIPLSIADCSARSRSAVIETFLKILALPQTRLGSTDVLSILEIPAVREKFTLTESNLGIIRSWIEQTSIHWGKDAAHRASLGLPEISNYTWRNGLDRLLLGYALNGNDRELYNGILPFDDVEGDSALSLGKFADFTGRLFATVEGLNASHSLSGWAELFRGLIETFFEAYEQTESDLKTIRTALANFERDEDLVGFDTEIPLDVILEPLTRKLNEDPSGAGYLTGGVTFCALKPARSIPFKIICLVGMNDNVFPRTDSWLSFDLMAQNPRLGDRSSREDDRYLFLETLISAREKLYISYTGQSIRDNSSSPPSVLVNQLLDYIEQGFTSGEKTGIAEDIVVRHRLQAFSRDYFTEGRLFSYSRENFAAGRSIQADRIEPAPFLAGAIPEPEAEFRQVSVEALIDFFCHPARFLARNRLGIYLLESRDALEDSEPFALNALDNYQLKERLLELRVAGQSLHEASALFHASGTLPAGMAGEAAFGNVYRTVESFYRKLEPHLTDVLVIPTPIQLNVGDFQVTGEFKNVTEAGLVSYRCADVRPRDLLRGWISHVVLNALSGQPPVSKIIGTDMLCTLGEVKAPQAVLESLLKIYWQGLARPLKFFPRSSFAYVEAQGKQRKNPLSAARKEWEGNQFFGGPGEGGDPYFNLFFRNTDPFDDDFAALAGEIIRPILEHAKQTEL